MGLREAVSLRAVPQSGSVRGSFGAGPCPRVGLSKAVFLRGHAAAWLCEKQFYTDNILLFCLHTSAGDQAKVQIAFTEKIAFTTNDQAFLLRAPAMEIAHHT